MNILSVENLTKSFGDRILFKNINFGIAEGQKIALVARNGAGKTTLLKILSGEENPDSGNVAFRKDCTIGILSQDPKMDAQLTVSEAVVQAGGEALHAFREYERLLLVPSTPAIEKQIENLINTIEALDAWQKEDQMKQILHQLKITRLDQKIGELSGGQKKRVALAALLIREPEVLILDEPTNHLDIEMIEWLEDYLSKSKRTLLMVTHDRYFLDKVCTQILEIDQESMYIYRGKAETHEMYEYFLEKKAERIAAEQSQFEKNNNTLRKELAWVRKMPRARGTKSKSRMDAYYELKEENNRKKQQGDIVLNVKMSRMGGKIVEFKHVNKSFIRGGGEDGRLPDELKILQDFSYTFKTGEKIGIIGKNGVGKSTFLNILLGLEKADSGEIEKGDTLVFGYYSQAGLQGADHKRIIEVVKDIAEIITLGDGTQITASQFLQQFQFPPEQQYTYVAKLSGGEKRRLFLLTILMKNPNFLIMDEPTNDLDLWTIHILEDFLSTYKGCLLIVSHDRYFMDQLVDHLFVFEGDGQVRDFNGSYDDYTMEQALALELVKESTKSKVIIPAAVVNTQTVKKPSKNQVQKDKLEQEIAELEKQKDDLTQKLSDATLAHEDLLILSIQIAELEAEIVVKTDAWMEG